MEQQRVSNISSVQLNPQQLNTLFNGQMIYVDEQLKPCMANDAVLTLTFKDDNLVIVNGKFSHNGIYVNEKRLAREELVTLRTGDSFKIIDTTVCIRSSELASDNALEDNIANLEIGNSLIIGRNDLPPEIAKLVSRQHLTITKLNKNEYALRDGAAAAVEILEQMPDGTEIPISFKKVLPIGQSINLKIGSNYFSFKAPEKEDYFEYQLETDTPLPEMCLNLSSKVSNQNAKDDLPVHSHSSRQILFEHILTGVQLIKDGFFEAAQRHFRKEDKLLEAGFSILDLVTRGNPSMQLIASEVSDLLIKLAVASKVNHQSGTISLALPNVVINSSFQLSDQQRNLLNLLYYETALLHAEEWIHACQSPANANIQDLPISKHGALLEFISFNPNEVDVAMFFVEQGLPMTRQFKDRYERAEGLKRIESSITTDELNLITNSLSTLPQNQVFTVGFDNISRARKDNDQLIFPRKSSTFVKNPDKDISNEFKKKQLSITKQTNGSYIIVPINEPRDKALVFYKDEDGYWQRIVAPLAVPARTAIRLGTSFEFELPIVN